MPIKVLLADNDLDIHKLISDLLPILFNKVVVDRALNSESVLAKLSDPNAAYNLVILDLAIGDAGGSGMLEEIAARFPQVLARTVLILDSPNLLPPDEKFAKIAHVVKPFSLDEFSDMAKKACTR